MIKIKKWQVTTFWQTYVTHIAVNDLGKSGASKISFLN